ncbi:unnamed protein product [Adineta steineri]|uniref:Fibrinogen C-terminal domain-containing protein n=1 Tax=Adineta steineri TaxID=433720 RepID=A0A813TS70_9BILA|nr:unnamed protein product [Adineta steineri]CAF1424815.1 unnamed protein product [Adineta steineri]CAF1425411.1 unnamed protein product [Adineta steineri]
MLFKFIILFVTVNLLVEFGNANNLRIRPRRPRPHTTTEDSDEDKKRGPIDCAAIYRDQEREDLDSTNGVYEIYPRDITSFEVFCDMENDGGGWTLIQRRGEFRHQEDFYRDWNEYKNGFGNITREFWLGNDKIYTLTNQDKYDLRFDLEDYEGLKRFAVYSGFRIGDESTGYQMTYDAFLKGDAGDSLSSHKDMKFTTKDRDNDLSTQYGNCAQTYKGAWWYKDCHLSNPNGERKNNKLGEGLDWYSWHGYYYSLNKIEIKIRPSNFKKL